MANNEIAKNAFVSYADFYAMRGFTAEEIAEDVRLSAEDLFYKTLAAIEVVRNMPEFKSYDSQLIWAEEQLNIARRTYDRYLNALSVVNQLKLGSHGTLMPTGERQVRAIAKAKLDGEAIRTVWADVEKRVAEGQRLTGRLVEESVAAFQAGGSPVVSPARSQKNGKPNTDQFEEAKQEDLSNKEEINQLEPEKPEEELEQDYILLADWKKLTKGRQDSLTEADPSTTKRFNKQTGDSIEWARWSWNPVTGCRHDCSYCYARDIAERFYPQGFAPSLYPDRLGIPYAQQPNEKDVAQDLAFKNVFTCSMADLFGRWVPDEWIEAVLWTIAENEQWNFLMLTKFPKRMAEFHIPDNAWMGTTVDCQVRVAAAEKAFAEVDCKVKWLSVEPMLEDIQFQNLELFDWVVMGGSAKSSQTPAWAPPFDWVVNLHSQARAAGCKIYQKTNLFSGQNGSEWMSRLREWPSIDRHERMLPEEFKYMKSIK